MAILSIQPSFLLASDQFKTITAPEVNHMINDQGNGVLIHVLSPLEYETQHIRGSINIPVNKLETTDQLPTAKDTPLIFYCMGSW
jgi:rhodanese-related sulfurtransferase